MIRTFKGKETNKKRLFEGLEVVEDVISSFLSNVVTFKQAKEMALNGGSWLSGLQVVILKTGFLIRDWQYGDQEEWHLATALGEASKLRERNTHLKLLT